MEEPALKVLLVEDDDDAREILSQLLVLHGCVVSAHGTAGDGIAAIGGFSPHVAIVDLQLPDLDGIQVIRSLRSAHVHQPRIVVVTGWASEDARQRTLEAGADVFLPKPATYDQLLATLGLPKKS